MYEERALSRPGIGLRRHLLDHQPALELAIGEVETLQLVEIKRIKRAQISLHQTGLDQRRFELGNSLHQRVDEAAKSSRAREGTELRSIE